MPYIPKRVASWRDLGAGIPWLALGKPKTFDPVYAREPVMHLCGRAASTTRALAPHLLYRFGERPAAEAPLLLCKLTNSEVCLLLAGARSTESYTPHFHDRSMGAGILCINPYLARNQHRRLDQDNPLSTNDSTRLLLVLLYSVSVVY